MKLFLGQFVLDFCSDPRRLAFVGVCLVFRSANRRFPVISVQVGECVNLLNERISDGLLGTFSMFCLSSELSEELKEDFFSMF